MFTTRPKQLGTTDAEAHTTNKQRKLCSIRMRGYIFRIEYLN